MNSRIAILAILAIFLFSAVSCANAITIKALDSNGSPQAAPGEWLDLNVAGFHTATATDRNYIFLVRLSYQGSFTDVNVVDGNWASGSESIIDLNINMATYGCGAADLNNIKGIFVDANSPNDGNKFDVNFQIPATYPSNRMVDVNIYRVQKIGDLNFCMGPHPGADVNVMITPYLKIMDINLNRGYTPYITRIDRNVALFGFGFDGNVKIVFSDTNGWRIDLNILDTNNLTMLDANYGKRQTKYASGCDDNVHNSITQAGLGTPQAKYTASHIGDYNGVRIVPDANGRFDVNVRVPFTFSLAGPGGAPDINLVADSNGVGQIDANLNIIIVPTITRSADENVTILICDSNRSCWWNDSTASTKIRYDIEKAMMNNYINNMESAKGFQIDLGLRTGAPCAVRVQMNADMNMMKGPQRNYSSNMGEGKGIRIDSNSMPEFAIDANITFYNVKTTGPMPWPTKNGMKCPTNACKNRDGSTLTPDYTDPVTGKKTWEYNSTSGDGNLQFRVSGFSEYALLTLSGDVNRPNVAGDIRHKDGNYSVLFSFKDTNEGTTFIKGGISLGSTAGSKDRLIIWDNNLLDDQGDINCYFSLDRNIANTHSCTYDLNTYGIYGNYYIDVNLEMFDGNTLTMSSPRMKINGPYVNVWDTNIAGGDYNFTYGTDRNWHIDFNISTSDGNYSLQDVNILIYASATQGAKTWLLNWDSNALDGNGKTNTLVSDYNGIIMKCTNMAMKLHRDTNFFNGDYNCHSDINLMGIPAGRYYIDIDTNVHNMKGAIHHTGAVLDTNQLGGVSDVNYSAQTVIINDWTAPTLTLTSTNPVNATSSTTILWSATDAVAGIKRYWFSSDNVSWENLGTSTGKTVSNAVTQTKSYYIIAMDKADLNSATTTVVVNYHVGGDSGTTTTTTTSGGGGGSSGGGTATTETVIVETSQSYIPDATQIETILQDAGISGEAENAISNVDNFPLERSLEVTRTTTGSSSSYSSIFTLSIMNNSGTTQDLRVIETIPKTIADSASQVVSNNVYNVLVEDPVLEFVFPGVPAGETRTAQYSINKNITEISFQSMVSPVALGAEVSVPDPCEGKVCDDSNPCTTDYCDAGNCMYRNKLDNTSCGTGMICKSGGCIAEEAPYVPPAQPAQDYTMYIIIAIIIILIIAGAYFMFGKKNKSGWK